MKGDVKIITTYDNKQVELAFNESFLCPKKEIEIVDIDLGEKIFNWKMRIVIEPKEGSTSFESILKYNVDGFSLHITLFNWISPTPIELREPFVVKTESGNATLYIKIKTTSTERSTGREIHLSIWKSI